MFSKLFRSDRCYNGGNRHKFEARYSEKESSNPLIRVKSEGGHSISDFRKLNFYDEYVYDICVWCGKILYNIKRTNYAQSPITNPGTKSNLP